MNREYHHWYSPALGREMELLLFGHAGARMLVFPTSKGRFYEWEDRQMMATLGDAIENGHLQVMCVDSVDEERIESVKETLQYMLGEDELRNAALLVLANKQVSCTALCCAVPHVECAHVMKC